MAKQPAEKENLSSKKFNTQKLIFFENFADSIEEAILFFENPQKITYCNNNAEVLSGYSKEDLLSGELSLESIIYKKDIATFYSALKTAKTNGTAHKKNLRLNLKNRDIPTTVTAVVRYISPNQVTKGYTITLKKKSLEHNRNVSHEKILLKQKEITDRYKAIFENLSIGIAVLDASLEIQSTNEPLKKILNYKKSEHTKKCYTLFFNRQKACANCAAEKTFSDGKVHTETSEFVTAGKKRTLQFTTNPIYDDNGNIIKVI